MPSSDPNYSRAYYQKNKDRLIDINRDKQRKLYENPETKQKILERNRLRYQERTRVFNEYVANKAKEEAERLFNEYVAKEKEAETRID